jgi:hypothetical protein
VENRSAAYVPERLAHALNCCRFPIQDEPRNKGGQAFILIEFRIMPNRESAALGHAAGNFNLFFYRAL